MRKVFDILNSPLLKCHRQNFIMKIIYSPNIVNLIFLIFSAQKQVAFPAKKIFMSTR